MIRVPRGASWDDRLPYRLPIPPTPGHAWTTDDAVAVLRVLPAEPATPRYGLDLARETGLKTGTPHPILARLQQAGWVTSSWEDPGRP
jgi:hypothetical protein